MSGGSYNYIYMRLKEECDGMMYDAEMDDMIRDLAEVLHDLEWWQSGDSSEDKYRATLAKFKAKWFLGNREERLKGYIDNQIAIVRKQLYALIGEPTEPKSEWQKDNEILKAYSDGANGVLDEIRAEIAEIETYDGIYIDRAYVLQIIDKYRTESE